jgi:hypothetical protein
MKKWIKYSLFTGIILVSLLIPVFLFFFGCKQQPEKTFTAKYIIDINNPVDISIDDFVTDIDTIRLWYPRNVHDNKFYVSISPTPDLGEMKDNISNEKIKMLLEKTKFDANPVLISFSIKIP